MQVQQVGTVGIVCMQLTFRHYKQCHVLTRIEQWLCSEPSPCAKQIIFPFYLKYINVHSENIVAGTTTARRCTCEFYKQGRQTMLTLNSVSTKLFIISIHLSP